MEWSALTKRQQQMAVATGVLVLTQIVLMAHFLGWTRPADQRGGVAKKELIELETKLEEVRMVLLREELVRGELARSVQRLEELAVHAPMSSDRYAWAYEYVSRCAASSRVELDSVEEILYAGETPEASATRPYEISISTECGYNRLVEFIGRLEQDNPLLRVKEVTISAQPGRNEMHRVRILIQWPPSVVVRKGDA
jgi:hypothetical protein